MKSSLLLVIAALVAFTLLGASSSKSPRDPILINLADVLPEHIQVRVQSKTSAHLIFFFAQKSKREVDAIVQRGGDRPVHIVDGVRLIGKAKQIDGSIGFISRRDEKMYGLILKFESVEEAERVAREMQPPKGVDDQPPNHALHRTAAQHGVFDTPGSSDAGFAARDCFRRRSVS